MQLYGHPFSSYCQKVLIALYENATPFEFRAFGPEDPQAFTEFEALWPLKKMPLLRDGERTVVESSLIIEYLDLTRGGAVRFVPTDARAALEVRQWDRIFDNYVMTPMQKLVGDFIRPPEQRDPKGVADAHALLDQSYAWLESNLPRDGWAVGKSFSLADCAAAPALFYSDWVHPIGASQENLQSYRRRLLAHPSFARAVDEARPFRVLFPPGAPDRD